MRRGLEGQGGHTTGPRSWRNGEVDVSQRVGDKYCLNTFYEIFKELMQLLFLNPAIKYYILYYAELTKQWITLIAHIK